MLRIPRLALFPVTPHPLFRLGSHGSPRSRCSRKHETEEPRARRLAPRAAV